jgi:hypothetical protein
MTEIVIFLITYNRLSILDRTIKSYQQLNTNIDIIIIDNGTDDKECLLYLNSNCNNQVKNVYNYDKIKCMDDIIDNVNKSITRYYNHNQPKYYAVSDCDISFESSDKDTLNIYMKLCDELNLNIGPNLSIVDLPENYPLRFKVMIDYFYRNYKTFPRKKYYNNISYYVDSIDTTFTLFNYEKNKTYKRLTECANVYYPYDAKHLDWYIDVLNIPQDYYAYWKKTTNIGSWGGGWVGSIVHAINTNTQDEYFNILDKLFDDKDIIPSYCIDFSDLVWFYYRKNNIDKCKEIVLKYINNLHYVKNMNNKDNYINDLITFLFA